MGHPRVLGEEFARDTGELAARRWKVGLALYLIFAAVGSLAEWQRYPQRELLLLAAWTLQVLVAGAAWIALRGSPPYPRAAWIVLGCLVAVPLIVAGYNAAVGGGMLYVLLTFLIIMLASSMFVPWGARFQLGLNCGILGAYVLGQVGGGQGGPVPAYDYTAIAATMVVSTLGAWYLDQYRRKFFEQARALRDANQRLETANQARGELLANASHELRTPLTAIIGYGQLALEGAFGELSSPLREVTQRMLDSGLQQLRLVDDLLAVSRLALGQLSVRPEHVPLAPVLADMGRVTTELLQERPIQVAVHPVDPGLCAYADPARLRQILTNLLTNAAKFTEAGTIELRALANGACVRIGVADTGVGISPADHEQIFDPFLQLDAGRATAGAGLGLSIAQRLAKLMGGTLTVESEIGHGATFWLTLPLAGGYCES